MKYSWFLRSTLLVIFTFLEIAFSYSNKISGESYIIGYSSSIRVPLKLKNSDSALEEMKLADEEIRRFLQKHKIHGASVAIVKDGRLIYTKGFGYSNLDLQEQVEPEHLFRIASASKLVTAVAIMKLMEEGKLKLDDKVFGVEGILNDSSFQNIRDPRTKNITVEHLLRHQGGWNINYGDPMFEPLEVAQAMGVPPPASPETVIAYALDRRLHFNPGTRSSYSNLGYCILGKVISKVAQKPFEQYIALAILNPLGIYDMQLGKNLLEKKAPNEVCYYDYIGAVERLSVYGTGEFVSRTYAGTNIEALGAAGGWIASSAQLMRLLVSIDGLDSKPDILKPETLQLMADVGPEHARMSPIGWRGANESGDWWRTGTLAGTSALMMRKENGISYSIILNTSTYSGARFTAEINRMMTRAINTIDYWPEHDLFDHYEPTALLPIPPVGWPAPER